MSEAHYKAPAPCDSVREPFFSRGYCVACNWLVELHTAEGWRKYHTERAAACEQSLLSHQRRVAELRAAVLAAEVDAENPPAFTPFAETGYISVHEPRRFPETTP